MRRRQFIRGGGSLATALAFAPRFAIGGPVGEIAMQGRPDGSKVWFTPYGLLIRPGQTIRWTNKDNGNSHTATAYASENFDHSRRIPDGTKPFDSGLLLPDESFEVTFDVPGVYDYFCIPHELSGMVGRIVVAPLDQTLIEDYPDGDLDQAILAGFPPIADILKQGSLEKGE